MSPNSGNSAKTTSSGVIWPNSALPHAPAAFRFAFYILHFAFPDPPDPTQVLSVIQTIKRLVPALLPNRPAVAAVDPVSEDRGHSVWKVRTQTGAAVVAKYQPFARLTQGAPYDLLEVERLVCGRLRAAGCPVPEVYGICAEDGLIFFEWCGDRTLDDLCQASGPDVLPEYADRVIRGYLATETFFRTSGLLLSGRAFPGCAPEDLRTSWADVAKSAGRCLPDLVACLNPAAAPFSKRISDCFSDRLHALGKASPVLGPTDYNARNIVVNPETRDLRFIEFAKLGWDWPERRLAQYATSLGAGRADGGFQGLIDCRAAACYAARAADIQATDSDEILRRLDGHHFVFYLLAGARLLAALSNPSNAQNAALLTAWQNPRERLEQVRQALAAPLSDHPATCELRSLFSKMER